MDDIQSVKELNGDIFLEFAHNKICSLHSRWQFFFHSAKSRPNFVWGLRMAPHWESDSKENVTCLTCHAPRRFRVLEGNLPTWQPLCETGTRKPTTTDYNLQNLTAAILTSNAHSFFLFSENGPGCFFLSHRFPGPCDPAETTTGASWSQATLMENTSGKTDQIMLPAWRQLRWHLFFGQRKPTEIRNPCPKVVLCE